MRAIIAGVASAAVLGLVLGACGGGGDAQPTTNTTTQQPTVFNVTMNGASEVPGPGAVDGTGTAEISVDPNGTQICFSISVANLDAVTAAHIHEGKAGVSGPIVATLAAPTTGHSEGCVDAAAPLIQTLSAGSSSYYVNVHTTAFPDGAIRAQLSG